MSQSATIIASSPSATSELETSTVRAISLRLIPFLVLAISFPISTASISASPR
jgi:hypothetical protein